MKNLMFILFLGLVLPLSSQSTKKDSLRSVILKKYTKDRVILPVYGRFAADIQFKEFDLKGYKVHNPKGSFNLEVMICGQKILFPKSNDLTSVDGVKFEDLLLENGNILVATGWVHTIVVGHQDYTDIITTYEHGLITSQIYLKNEQVIKCEQSNFDFSKCR